ncbi:hypothetical protein BO94DRAFT_532230 [Aspergillus sclerotioniger CBS 115572]|uniref:Uncharacterized protein n=1 Tax=Aspergillus sclerotioniger CBS 115572 TaxID=1450535 RepID=A0A317XCL9_9EURO|nr:hypothetical protein BO94DRAFT_532230 [Aspergillus sclerotioniger CBS 115572]PWY94290.1 hypothetical protein BO94DRAFT_532230 [Aspergillus sclerotioniger CBS 115572]
MSPAYDHLQHQPGSSPRLSMPRTAPYHVAPGESIPVTKWQMQLVDDPLWGWFWALSFMLPT